MPRYLACAALLLAGLAPFAALALGLGEIDLKSGLNQPFRAEIKVSSESADELTGLDVKVASREIFDQFGVDRAKFLSDFEFAVVTRAGRTTIQITSRQPIVEPFVTLLLEIRWPQGRLLREYTVLLDPPAFATPAVEPAIQEPVAGPEAIPEPARIQRAPEPAAAVPEPAPAPAEAAPPPVVVTPAAPPPVEPAPIAETPAAETPVAEPPVPAEPAPLAETPAAETPAAEPPPPAREAPAAPSEVPSSADELTEAGPTVVPVVRGDTLWDIAGTVPADASIDRNQMMLAIFRANPEAFVGNINRLKAGTILRIPDAEEFGRLDRRAAMVEVQRQIDDWRPATSESARLRLVPPPEPGAGDAATTEGQTGAVDRENLRARIADLEVELADSQRLIQLRDGELEALQAQLAALRQRLAETSAAAEPAEMPPADIGQVIDEAPEPAVEPAVETGAAPADAEGLASEPTPPPIVETVETTPAPAEVVTTSAPQAPTSWVGALFTNIWLYVSLFVVLALALFVVRRRPAMSDEGSEAWDEGPGADIRDLTIGDLDGDLGDDLGEPSGALAPAEGTADTFIVEEIQPAERTIQEDRVQDPLTDAFATAASDTGGLDIDAEAGAIDEVFLDDATGGDIREMPTEATGELEPESEPEPDLEFDPIPDFDSEPESELTGAFETAAELEPVPEPESELTGAFETAAELEPVPEPEPESGPAFDTATDLKIEPEEEAEAGPEEKPDSAYAAAGEDTEMPFERTISIASPANLDEADPIAEADFHMAYGLYDQAASLLTDAIESADNQKELRLKLLEVYFIWENADEFLKEATAIQSHLDGESDPDWNKVLIMGKQICPDEALFAATVHIPGQAGDVDLAFGDDSEEDEYDVDVPLADGALDLEDATAEPLDIAGIGENTGAELDLELDEDLAPTALAAQIDEDEDTVETPTVNSAAVEPTVDMAALEPLTETPEGEVAEDTDAVTAESPTVDIAAIEPMTETPRGEVEEYEGAATAESPTVDMAAIESTMETPTIKTEVALRALDEGGLDFAMGDEDSDDEDLLSISSVDLAAETLHVEVDDTGIRSLDSEENADEEAFQGLEPTEIMQRAEGVSLEETIEQLLGDASGEVSELAGTDTLHRLEDGDDSIGDASTQTEVGTKLDLARAYIDMGDPDGARSILNEVIEEAGDSQRQEAQQLLSGLG